MIQITRLIGKESNYIVLKYIRVNFILPVFLGPRFSGGGGSKMILCTIFMQLGKYIDRHKI